MNLGCAACAVCEPNWLKLNDGILVTNLSFKKKLTTRTFVLLFKTNNKEKKMTEQKSPKRKPFWKLNEEEQQQLVERTSRALSIDDRFWFLDRKEIRNLSTKKLHEVIAQTILVYDAKEAGLKFCDAISELVDKLLEDGKITEQKRLEIYKYAYHLRFCLKTATGIDVTHSCAPLNYCLYGLLHSCPTEFRQEIETIIQNSGLFPKCAREQPEYCPFLAKQEFKNVDNFKEFKHYEEKICSACKTKQK